MPAAQLFMTTTGATSHALCKYLRRGTARGSARLIAVEVIAFARLEHFYRRLETL